MPSSSKSQIGGLIRAARERRRWTQAELGDRIGVDRKTVDNWENGRTSPRNRIGALEEVLSIDLRDDGYEDAAEEESASESAVIDAILRDDSLIEEAKDHLLNQYGLLRRLSPPTLSDRRSRQAARRAAAPPDVEPAARAVARSGDPADRGEVRRLARRAREAHKAQNTGKDE